MFNINPWKESGRLAARENFPVSSFQKEINRLFSDFFDDTNGYSLLSAKDSDNTFLAPAIDVTEDDTGYKVIAELPGLNREDIDVDIENHFLTIKGEKQTSTEDEEKNFIRRERHFGSFKRTMKLPETADLEKIAATFNKGVLQVSIPKKEDAVSTPQKIDIGEAKPETKPGTE